MKERTNSQLSEMDWPIPAAQTWSLLLDDGVPTQRLLVEHCNWPCFPVATHQKTGVLQMLESLDRSVAPALGHGGEYVWCRSWKTLSCGLCGTSVDSCSSTL